ncbi:MAG: alpha/beta fold hydrolase [Promethearchaeota archaeon]|nr:MAG: alpha/beta fold hydrolase [Candidatus Lokiarchaeota archaeon]
MLDQKRNAHALNEYLNKMRTNPKTLKEVQEYFTTKSGDELFYRRWTGDNTRKIVIGLHGMAAHSEYFIQVADQLIESEITLYALDLKHHGYSTGKKGDLKSFEEIASHLYEFISYVRKDHPHTPIFLMGISMGGIISINYSVRYPDSVEGLILMAPGVKSEFKLSPGDILKLPLLIFIYIVKKSATVINVGERSERGTRNPLRIEYQNNDELRIQKVSPRYLIGLLKQKKKAFENASNISHPVLIMIGTEDKIVSVEGVEEFYDLLTVEDKTLIKLPGAYHSLFSDPAMHEEKGWTRLMEWVEKRGSVS